MRRFVLAPQAPEGPKFRLGFAEVGSLTQRDALLAEIEPRLEADGIEVLRLDLKPTPDEARLLRRLRELLEAHPGEGERRRAVMVVGLEATLTTREAVGGRPPLLGAVNLQRDAFPESVPCPVVVWALPYDLSLVARHAPDFWRWRSAVFGFQLATRDKIALADQERFRSDKEIENVTGTDRTLRLGTLLNLVAEAREAIDPADRASRLRLADLLIRLGDAQKRQSNLRASSKAYQEALLLCQDGNAESRVALCHNRLGDLALQLGDTNAARDAYQAALDIAQKLANDDPGDAQAQRDLSISHNKIGNLALQLGDTNAARDAYQATLDIAQKLANDDPGDAQAQRDLSISHEKIGNLALKLGDTNAARDAYQAALNLRQKLANDDPGDAQAQRDLSVSHNKIGDLALKLGDTNAARDAYQVALNLRQKLANDDPGDAQAQRDVMVSCYKLGSADVAAEEPGKAAGWYEQAVAVLDRMIDHGMDPENSRRERDLVAEELKRAREAG